MGRAGGPIGISQINVPVENEGIDLKVFKPVKFWTYTFRAF